MTCWIMHKVRLIEVQKFGPVPTADKNEKKLNQCTSFFINMELMAVKGSTQQNCDVSVCAKFGFFDRWIKIGGIHGRTSLQATRLADRPLSS